MNKLSFNQNDLLDNYDVDFAMAYWSWVFRQNWYSSDDNPMIDFVFWANNIEEWHKWNLESNKPDYSYLVRIFWIKFINYLQKTWAKIYYNPYCKFENNSIKYWAISINDLIEDLEQWNYLYVAWRLQKPVHILKSNIQIDQAINKNLKNALTTALLLLPEKFTKKDLFTTITSLSYMGDSRMKYWENPHKISNIVDKNMQWFLDLYRDQIESVSGILKFIDDENMTQDKSEKTSFELFESLPIWLYSKLKFSTDHEELKQNICLAISDIVNSPSIWQTIKWIFTGWVVKSVKYASEKIKKARKK